MGYATTVFPSQSEPRQVETTSRANAYIDPSKRPRLVTSISQQSPVGTNGNPMRTYVEDITTTSSATPIDSMRVESEPWTGSPMAETPLAAARTDALMTDAPETATTSQQLSNTANSVAAPRSSVHGLTKATMSASTTPKISNPRTNSVHSQQLRNPEPTPTPQSIIQNLPQQVSQTNPNAVSPRLPQQTNDAVPLTNNFGVQTVQQQLLNGSTMPNNSTLLPRPAPTSILINDRYFGNARLLQDSEISVLSFFARDPPVEPTPYSQLIKGPYDKLEQILNRSDIDGFAHGRFTVVSYAVQKNDQLFLVLHQIMCNYVERSVIWPPLLENTRATQFVQSLVGTRRMEPAINTAFRDFPYPFALLARDFPEHFGYWVKHIHIMFEKVGVAWDKVCNMSIQRRYPPTVKEFLNLLGIPSVELMECCVVLTLRKIWHPEDQVMGQYLEKAKEVFVQNLEAMKLCGQNLQAMVDLDERLYRQAYVHLDVALTKTRENHFQSLQQQHYQMAQLAGNRQFMNSYQHPVADIQYTIAQQHATARIPHQHVLPSQLMHGQSTTRQMAPYLSPMYASPSPIISTDAFQAPVSRRSSSAIQQPRTPSTIHPSSRGYSTTTNTPPQIQTPNSNGSSPAPDARFYPASGFRAAQPRVPIPDRVAMHQAHLAEPPMRILEGGQAVSLPFFQYTDDNRKLVYELHSNRVNHPVLFQVDQVEFARLPTKETIISLIGTGVNVRTLKPDSVQFRLRCFQKQKGRKTDFPPWLYLKLNGQILEIRRKLQYGSDLPIDITDMVRPGDNLLELALSLGTGDKKAIGWIITVETIQLTTESKIKESATTNALTEKDVIATMITNLSTQDGTDEDDDEIMMVSSNLKIKVADPITRGLIGEMPVRTATCKHSDCFSLEIFLESRPRVKHKINDPHKWLNVLEATISEADKWTCPMFGCDEDARPSKLRVDLWMKKIQSLLVDKENGNDCVVVVEKDGSWRIEEPKKDQSAD